MRYQDLQRAPGSLPQRNRKFVDLNQATIPYDVQSIDITISNTEPTFETEKLVHTLIEQRVKKAPQSIATQFDTQQLLTYEQLNNISNAIARQISWTRGTIVPIAIPRSTNLIIALLAVLKAGAAYVLLSTDAPHERNQFIVNDTRAALVIVDSSTQGGLYGVEEAFIEDLITRSKRMDIKYHTDLNMFQESSEIAYVIYTSGTTGHPKGVLLSHAAAYAGLSALPTLDESQPFRQLLCHSPNFSAAQRTILGTLCRGGTLCLASKENITLHLNETIGRMGISSLEITPSMLKLIEPSTVPASIKRITLGGEAVGPELVRKWAGRVELISAYGISECTQLNMRHQLRHGQSSRSIGRPVDTTTCYVLVPGSFEKVPPLVPGELCLGGDQLGYGYLNLPEKSSEVFVRNPFGPGRLYRTGDMVLAHEDGTIELIGRIDQQIKIDGQRVEPSESNFIIQLQPGVVQSSVISAVVHNRVALVALIVAEEETEWTSLVRELRSELRNQLPSYAIPRYWVQRKEMPLTVSGKVDIVSLRKIVESMDAGQLISSSLSSAQSSTLSLPVQESDALAVAGIAQIIATVLSIPPSMVDPEASFLELGGSSLDAIVIASSLRKMQVHISVADILESKSIREMAMCRTEPHPEYEITPRPFTLLPEGVKFDRTGVEDAYPVTPLQEGILADAIMGNANYVYQRVYKLNGVSPAQVRVGLEMVLACNSILRTTFFPWKRSFVQVINQTTTLPWTQDSGTSLESFLRKSSAIEMPIEGPLIRAAVVENDDILVLEMHHSLFDFWSSQFVIEDTVAILQGKPSIPRLPFNSYVSFLQHTENDKTKDFWKNYLQSARPTVLDITTNQVSSQSNAPFVLKSDIDTGLVELSHAHGVTVGAVVHAAWALTLASVLDSADVTFVAAFSGRDADLDGILSLNGPTLCTVPMRMRIDETLSAVGFTKSVQSNLWNLSKYAPSGMRNALRDGSLRPNAFNTMVNILVNLPDFQEDSPLLPIITHGDNFTQYITIEINETDLTSAKMLIPFSADRASAQTLLDKFVGILGSMVAEPTRSVGEVSSSISYHEVTGDLPISADHDWAFGLAHSTFESFADSTPSKVAIRTASGRTLSYGELNAKANAFASWLLSQGVQHGEMIPLYMEKSPETLISILGILKAGASFTPLDPQNPHDRNAFIVQDVKALRIVSDRKNREACASFGVQLIITEDMDLPTEHVENIKIADLTPESVIYAIYTSGSTGLPKGVLVQHSAVSASTEGMIEATAVSSEWNALWVLNYVFDASYYDVFTIFSAGATLCLAPQDELLSNLAKYINDLEIEQVMLTPTITKLITGGPSEVPRLKVLNVCGEKIDTNILQWAQSIDVYNGYGPTEATILMTVSHVQPNGSLNSIGAPLKHVEAVIVSPEDGSLKRVPHGTVGELCVRGFQLAKGYLNRPEQTAAAFVQDADGEPLYRTGDLARWADDGSLECLGRKDYQIKLNGFRIELGEIENAILHTGDVDAVIVSVAEVHGKRQLVGFCIFKGDHRLGSTKPLPAEDHLDRVTSLLSKLTTLSHYMVPALLLPFESFPTLPSGKANRKALVALIESMEKSELAHYIPHNGTSDELVPLSTEEERVMQQVWASVLDEPEESIGANSVFLSLGGDSISAINVVAMCRKLSYNISVSHILSNPTLAEQARNLKSAQEKKAVVEVKHDIPESIHQALKNVGIDFDEKIEDIYPCGPGQIEFLTQGHKEQQFWNLTACRELQQDFDLQRWIELTIQLTSRNQILRTMYYQANCDDDSSWYQIVHKQPVLDYEYILYSTEVEKVQHIKELRDSLFTFGKPNIKYRLLHCLANGSRTLCIKVDHGSYDGTLLRIFDDQFKALARGESDIPPINSFKHFIDWIYSGDRSDALKYWKSSLETYIPEHNLPLQPVADRLKFAVVTADVDSIATTFGVTASTVFQAAYSIVAGRLIGTNDVLVDNLLTGRNADVENPQLLNGTCATFLPFRSQLSEADSISQFLKDTQAQFWDTTEQGTVGLHDMYTALGKDRQVHSAKLLYCFQPFDPAPATAKLDHMRWIVMAQSKVFMTINYALMVEVQKTLQGHRFKLQWDSKALSDEQVDKVVVLFCEVLKEMGNNKDGRVDRLMNVDTDLDAVWRA